MINRTNLLILETIYPPQKKCDCHVQKEREQFEEKLELVGSEEVGQLGVWVVKLVDSLEVGY